VKQSRKTRYTELVLRQALVETLAEKEITAVTVTELCARADLSRGTFYLHYSSPAELLAHLEDDIFDTVTAPLRDSQDGDGHAFAETVLRTLAAQPEIARLALQPGSTLMERVFAFKREQTLHLCRRRFPDLDDNDLAYVQTFKEQGSVHLVRAWVAAGMAEPPERIAELLARLI
jgi:AcrR family transcriptional regulator